MANGETRFQAEASRFAVRGGNELRPESEFLALLGDRVREMRVLREMSRRELARKSRVSERYIAQIEAGKGNVSIMLLLRIAHAIRCG
jgi:DNA-binding XRE family transcriptional regulator